MKFFRRSFLKQSFFSLIGVSIVAGGVMRLFIKEKSNNKKIKFSFKVNQRHWVGDGFYVHGLLRPSPEMNKYISPFILMDYAAPWEFPKSIKQKGVGEHPHRGFETVTLAYQGEVEHRDSSGGGGVIKPGDVQWMTAGKGVIHDEFHSKDFSQAGGIFEMVQLWVNLPKKYKMVAPKYQGISSENIPKVKLGKKSELRILAGEFAGTKGAAETFTKINMYDITSTDEDNISLNLSDGTSTIILVMNGEVELENDTFNEKSILIFEHEGESINLKVSKEFKGLVLNGVPIDEPVVAHGPFVMNTKAEINEAIRDFNNGKMGNFNKKKGELK